YEMLTGKVPFEGESAGEILMKHLTAPPDLTKLPAAYVPIVAKALAKNPAQRYASITEMAKAVEALGPVDRPAGVPVRTSPAQRQDVPIRVEDMPAVLPVVSTRAQMAELAGSLALSAVLAALLATLYAALARPDNWSEVGKVMFLTVAVCWVVLIP